MLAVVAAFAAVAGGSIPATTSSMRLVFARLIRDEGLRPTAYALLATQFQIALVVGPVLVAALVLVRGPIGAVVGSAALSGAGGLLFAAAPASRAWRRSTVDGRSIVSRGLVTLFGAAFAGGVASGVVIVAIPAVSAPAFAGVLFAGLSAGELLGGFAYGVRAWLLSLPSRLVLGQLITAAALGGLALVAGHPAGMVPVMIAVGLATAPVGITSSALLDDVVPSSGLACAYTVMVAAGLIGVATGNWAGGVVSARYGVGLALLAAAVVPVGAAGWTFARRRSLDRPSILAS
jgi:hypothetical protein